MYVWNTRTAVLFAPTPWHLIAIIRFNADHTLETEHEESCLLFLLLISSLWHYLYMDSWILLLKFEGSSDSGEALRHTIIISTGSNKITKHQNQWQKPTVFGTNDKQSPQGACNSALSILESALTACRLSAVGRSVGGGNSGDRCSHCLCHGKSNRFHWIG